jgi:hypothetical protein
LIASGGAALQLPENVAAAPFRIGYQPGHDLLPLSRKGVLVGAPPTQDPFSPLLLSVEAVVPCCRTGDAPLDSLLLFDRKAFAIGLLVRYLFFRTSYERLLDKAARDWIQ